MSIQRIDKFISRLKCVSPASKIGGLGCLLETVWIAWVLDRDRLSYPDYTSEFDSLIDVDIAPLTTICPQQRVYSGYKHNQRSCLL